jgi:hypothetical protein
MERHPLPGLWVPSHLMHRIGPPTHAGLNKYSSRITQPKSQGASQAMLYATGLNEQDMNRPQARSRCC